MKSSFFVSTLVFALMVQTHAASVDFSANFNDLFLGTVEPEAYPDEIAGQGGWTINDSNQLVTFATTFAGSPAAAIGGYYNFASEPTVGLNHGYEATLSRTTATFDFGIIDSINSDAGRDEFAFSWYSGTTNLFSVIFAPTDPGDVNPDGDTDATWRLYYSANGGPRTTLDILAIEGGAYSLSLAMSPQGAQTGFELSVLTIGAPEGPLNPLIRNGAFAVAPGAEVDSFAFEWTPGPPDGGANYFVFDNVTAVPEPASALLAGLAGLAFVGSRRRRA